jgi:hypothetical protein
MFSSGEPEYRSERCTKRTKNQCRILSALMNKSSLSYKELSARTGIRSKTLYKELIDLLQCHVIDKDSHKLYSINPAYGKYLIDEGLQILGYQSPPEKVRFVSLILKLKLTVDEMMGCLKKMCVVMIGMCGWLWKMFSACAAILFFTILMKLK